MKYLSVILLVCVTFTTVTADDRVHCYKQQQRECARHGTGDLRKCTALYGGISANIQDLQSLISQHLSQSIRFMQMAAFFGTDHMNRRGFQKYFQKLSDDYWEDALELIQYVTRRGGRMDEGLETKLPSTELNAPGGPRYLEVTSLSRTLDIHKQVAEDVFTMHHYASRPMSNEEAIFRHDPELAHYLERKFTEKHGDRIREVAGHLTSVNTMLTLHEGDLGLYMYDNLLRSDQISGY